MVSSNYARYAPEIVTKSNDMGFIRADYDFYNTEIPPRIVEVDVAAAKRMSICSSHGIVGFVNFKTCASGALFWVKTRESGNT